MIIKDNKMILNENVKTLKTYKDILFNVLETDKNSVNEFIKQFDGLLITVKLPNVKLYVDDEMTYNMKVIESVKNNKTKLVSDEIMEDLILCGLNLSKNINNEEDEEIKKIYYKIFK